MNRLLCGNVVLCGRACASGSKDAKRRPPEKLARLVEKRLLWLENGRDKI